MSHAKALRVIGQILEAANVPTFEIEKYGPQYMVWSSSVSPSGEATIRLTLRQAQEFFPERRAVMPVFCFSSADIVRLDAEARSRGRNPLTAEPPAKLVSRGLRTLGDHFDCMQVHAFRIDWAVGSVTIDYQRISGPRNCKMLSFADLQYLCERAEGKRPSPETHLLLV